MALDITPYDERLAVPRAKFNGERAQLERNGSVLVSWETPDGHVQALDLPLPNGRRAARR